MVVGQNALVRVRREIGPKPGILCRAGRRRNVAVEREDVPGAEVVAVIPAAGRPRRRSEIRVVGSRARRIVFVIPRGWLGAMLMAPPRRVIAVVELGGRAVVVGVVADIVDGRGVGDGIQQFGSGFVAAITAARDVTGADEDLRRVGGEQSGRRREKRPDWSIE